MSGRQADGGTPASPALHDTGFEARVRASFALQGAMRLFGAQMTRVEHGRVEIEFPASDAICQQHGFVHGGVIGAVLDSACGFAALTTMPPDTGVLTVEYKINFVSPALGDRFLTSGSVRKAGRTITLAQGDAFALRDGERKLVATMTATMMTIAGRDDVRS